MCHKSAAKEMYLQALSSVMPKNLIQEALGYHDDVLRVGEEHFDLSAFNRLCIFGSGKAAIEMAKAMQVLLGERISKSVVVSNYDEKVAGVEILQSTHPLPSQKSIQAGERLIEEFGALEKEDFFIYLLSGGSSALIEKPRDGVCLEDFVETTKVLLHAGLSIDEINTIRKYLSEIKGGGLARKTKAKGIVLVVSDVIGDDLQAIGSAPLLADTSSQEDIKKIVDKYNILHLLPNSVKYLVENDDTSKRISGEVFAHFLIASNKIALQRAEKVAVEMGLSAKIITDTLEGDVKDVADFIVHEASVHTQEVLIFGGEPTVQVTGSGNGGRNQELCLWMLKQQQDLTFLSAGTDGIDGNSDAAGAVVCKEDYHDSLDGYLTNNDSYHYLKAQDALLMTGESGTNVMDIMIVIKG
jgi:hydroxypyruvate reductase/glycerate 2-kinase